MNVSKIIQDNDKVEKQSARDMALGFITERRTECENVLKAITGLKNNPNYQVFKRVVLDKAVEITEKRIKANEKELHNDKDNSRLKEIIRDNGMLVAFRKFSDLEKLEELYKAELDSIQKDLKKYD